MSQGRPHFAVQLVSVHRRRQVRYASHSGEARHSSTKVPWSQQRQEHSAQLSRAGYTADEHSPLCAAQ